MDASIKAHLATARHAIERGDWAQAEIALALALAIDPHHLDALTQHAVVLEGRRHPEQAYDVCTTILGLDPNNIQALGSRARLGAELGRYHDAILDYSRVIELTHKPFWHCGRAAVYQKLHQYDMALQDLDAAIQGGDSAAATFQRRGQMLFQLQRYEEAAADFTDAINREPSEARHYDERKESYLQLGRFDLAQADRETIRRLAQHRIDAIRRTAKPVIVALVQANTLLLSTSSDRSRSAGVLLSFHEDFAENPYELVALARDVFECKGDDADTSDPNVKYLADLLKTEDDGSHQRWRLPRSMTDGRVVYFTHLYITRSLLTHGHISQDLGALADLFACLAEKGDEGRIEMLPPNSRLAPRIPWPHERRTKFPRRKAAGDRDEREDSDDRPAKRPQRRGHPVLWTLAILSLVFLGIVGAVLAVRWMRPVVVAKVGPDAGKNPPLPGIEAPKEKIAPKPGMPPEIKPGVPVPWQVRPTPKDGRIANSYVWSINYSGDGQRVITADGVNTFGNIEIWKADTLEHVRPWCHSTSDTYGGCFGPDDWVAGAQGVFGLKIVNPAKPNESIGRTQAAAVRAVALSAKIDGVPRCASMCERELIVWDLRKDATRLWRADVDRPLSLWRGAVHLAFSPDGESLVAPSGGNDVRLHRADTGDLRATGKGHTATVIAVACSPDARWIASGAMDNRLILRNSQTLEPTKTLTCKGWVCGIAFSPDSALVAAATGANDTIKLWTVPDGELHAEFDGKGALDVAFSPDGKTLASSFYDGYVKFWKVP